MARRRARVRHQPQQAEESLGFTKGSLLADQPPGPQVLPLDPIHTRQVGGVNLNYENQIGRIGFDTTTLSQEFGFQPAFLPDGTPNPSAGQLDPSNPYSIAANLQRRFQQQQRGTTTSYASRHNQLGGGALRGMRAENAYQYGRSYDQARRAFDRGSLDLLDRRQGAVFERDTGLVQADSDRLTRLDPEQVVPSTPLATVPRKGVDPRQAQRRYTRRRRNG